MEPGNKIAHYEVLGTVGRGGMGVVYRARDTKLGRIVALKFLPSESWRDPHAKKRFVREARSASALDHPNICTIHDIAETDDGRLYIVMAYYEGRTLRDRLTDEAFSVDRVIAIGRQLAGALERAHAAGIVHRDLKPANIMLGERDEVKLLDFGVAKLTGDEDLTATKGTVGTVVYMSPEQLHGSDIDGRTDVWALGAVLYEMLAGRRPFDGESSAALITAILQQTPRPLAALRAEVPPDLAQLVHACLEKDRDARPADAGALLRGLEALVPGSGSISAEEKTRTLGVSTSAALGQLPRNRWRNRLAAAAVIVFAAAGLYWLMSRGSEAPAVATADDRVAVLPFTIRGSAELAYLGEGITDLVSARLDGIGGMTAVDPRVVISRALRDGLDTSSPEASAMLASRIGAGHYVTGDLLEVSGRVTLTAYLHHAGDRNAAPEKAIVEGNADEVFQLIDDLVADLVTDSMSAPGDRMTRTAAMTSRSLDATKEYLRGEQLMRQGRYREAAEAYDAAVGHDEQFALAHYRKSVASDWTDDPNVRTAAEKAHALADQLPRRERALMEGLLMRRQGRNREAEQAYRTILHRDPDDIEALLQLGEVLFHDNPRVGRSMYESVVPFERVIELEPANSNARIHLARLYALRHDMESLKATVEEFARTSAGSERALEVASLYAFLAEGPERQEQVLAELATKPAPYLFYAAHGLERFARSIDEARSVLEAGNSTAPLVLAIQAGLYVEQGRFEDFDRFLDGIPEKDSASWELYRAFLVTSGTRPVERETALALLDRLRKIEPDDVLKTSWLPPYEDMTLEYARFELDCHIALLLIHTDQLDEAREVIRAMRAMGPFPGIGSTQADVMHGLDAEIHILEGDDEAALDALRNIEYEIPHAITVRSIADGARSRFLRAELERRAGDVEVAKAYYAGLDESWSWWDTGYRPLVYRALAEMALEQGRDEEAADYYEKLLAIWEHADPVMAEERAAASSALDALGS